MAFRTPLNWIHSFICCLVGPALLWVLGMLAKSHPSHPGSINKNRLIEGARSLGRCLWQGDVNEEEGAIHSKIREEGFLIRENKGLALRTELTTSPLSSPGMQVLESGDLHLCHQWLAMGHRKLCRAWDRHLIDTDWTTELNTLT